MERLYRDRFSAAERESKDKIWQVLCQNFFQQFVRADADTVLDVGSGLGEFTRHIKARRKIAIDLNPESERLVPQGTEFHLSSAENMTAVPDNSVDVAFSSHFLEHLPSKAIVDGVLSEIYRVLKPGGIYVALQPNLRLCGWRYWDFHDHHVPMSDRSGREAFAAAGFEIEKLIPRFLPFTTKTWLPQHPALVRAYLAFPLAWLVLGKTFLIVGKKPS
ncbi:MAG: class I SAM-dependent methyltransferase [Vulcanimicrobiaceae bacterium]